MSEIGSVALRNAQEKWDAMADMRLARSDDGYGEFLDVLSDTFRERVGSKDDGPIFETNVSLWEMYLDTFPEEARQHYNCNCCHSFMRHYGTLVRVQDDGSLLPLCWNPDDPRLHGICLEIMRKLSRVVRSASISGLFLGETQELGTMRTGPWNHMAVTLPMDRVYRARLRTVQQEAAAVAEERRMLCGALREFSRETVETTLNLLRTESLYRGEKVLGVAEWFYGIIKTIWENKDIPSSYRNNLIWRTAATAPAGFCHVRSSMIGTLLEDIASGMDMETVKRRFAEKMNPLQYQRPQTAPAFGTIQRGNEIVEKLGLQASFRRRFARLEDLELIWTPSEIPSAKKTGDGFFDELLAKDERSPARPKAHDAGPITWEKFRRTVLPTARKIEWHATAIAHQLSAFVTAVDPESPPLFYYDREELRNPVNTYVYHWGSSPRQWSLPSFDSWVTVTGISYRPQMWYGNEDLHLYSNSTKGVTFIIKDCRDTRNNSLGLFPELLRSELHEIRSVVESYSNSHTLEGVEEASACGIQMDAGKDIREKFRVTTDLGSAVYTIDRWD